MRRPVQPRGRDPVGPERRAWTCLLFTALVTTVASGQASAPPMRVDGVAALVGGHAVASGVDVILRSDVELRAHLERAARGGDAAAGPLSPALLTATLNAIVDEHVIAREARRLQVTRASTADVAAERDRLVASAGGPERVARLLDALGARAEELDAIAARRALVGAFMSANLARASVDSGELARWVEQLRARTPLQVYATW